jgi:predicted P-loop ATPase
VIPAELKKNDNFVLYHRTNKIPVDPTTRLYAKINEPSTWSSYEEAKKAASSFGYGIGYIFDGSGICGIDIDNCIVDGNFSEMAKKVLALIPNTYAEYSPSRKGIHIFVKSKVPHTSRRMKGLEFYSSDRYFTLTGKTLPDRPEEINYCNLTEFMTLFNKKTVNCQRLAYSCNDLTIDEVLIYADQNEKFRHLYRDCDLAAYNHDESSADLALCSILAYWTAKDPEKMDDIFRKSPLMRDKWDRPTKGSTYGRITIDKAIIGCKKVFQRWMKKLHRDEKTGNICDTLANIIMILQHDVNLQVIAYNELQRYISIKSDLPWRSLFEGEWWRDEDDSQLIAYMDERYRYFTRAKYLDAIKKVADDRKYHPIRDYLNNLSWDNVERLDTLLITYFGVDDSAYVKAVTRKTLCAAVARIFNPGCKFDYILILNGKQGTWKSTFLRKLGKAWFNDSLMLQDTKDKTAAEKLQGYWILEISEMSGLKKTDVETLKAFISRQDDAYRASYGRHVTPHPRQCIFIGTTNAETGFLRDTTGNRRFWPVQCETGKDPRDISDDEVNQIWAEALTRYKQGEKLYLTKEIEAVAEEQQETFLEQDDRISMIEVYLEKLLPEDWDSYDTYKRRCYIQGDDILSAAGKVKRQTVCVAEIWCECFNKEWSTIKKIDSYEINGLLKSVKGWFNLKTLKYCGPYGKQRIFERRCIHV